MPREEGTFGARLEAVYLPKPSPTDALRQPIQIGKRYGVAVNSNGLTFVTIGKALRVTPTGKTTLEVESCHRALWDDALEPYESKSTITCKSANLFPVESI